MIEGEIRAAEEARASFEAAREEGRRAALVEQQRPNLFTAAVTNIPPGAEVTVEVSWLETLRNAGDAIKLPQLNFKLDAQREWSPDFDLALGAYAVRASSMDLSLGLLHEGDVLELFSMLDERADGQYSVRSCEFRSAVDTLTLDPTLANIRAECKLDWLTVDLSGEQGLEL